MPHAEQLSIKLYNDYNEICIYRYFGMESQIPNLSQSFT